MSTTTLLAAVNGLVVLGIGIAIRVMVGMSRKLEELSERVARLEGRLNGR